MAQRMIAEAIRLYGQNVMSDPSIPWSVRDTLWEISRCGTESMGTRVRVCEDCGHVELVNNSCGNRFCPYCNNGRKLRWRQMMESLTLPIHYFHVVFTVPNELNPVFLHAPEAFIGALFKAASGTMISLAAEKGVVLGMTGVFQSWGSNLSVHPHVHFIVTSGGKEINKDRKAPVKWKPLPWVNMDGNKDGAPDKNKFLFPALLMSCKFKALLLASLRESDLITRELREECYAKDWVVFAKDPVSAGYRAQTPQEGAKVIVDYISRYVYGTAISETRMVSVDGGMVTFRYKDYRCGGEVKTMSLDGEEFVRRYAQHILSTRAPRIRHYGLHAPASRKSLADVQRQLSVPPVPLKARKPSMEEVFEKAGISLGCRKCGSKNVYIYVPQDWDVWRKLHPGFGVGEEADEARPPTEEVVTELLLWQ